MSGPDDVLGRFGDDEIAAVGDTIDALDDDDLLALAADDTAAFAAVVTAAGVDGADGRPWTELVRLLAADIVDPIDPTDLLGEELALDPLAARRALLGALAGGGPAAAPARALLQVALDAASGLADADQLDDAVRAVRRADMAAAVRVLDELRPELDAALAATAPTPSPGRGTTWVLAQIRSIRDQVDALLGVAQQPSLALRGSAAPGATVVPVGAPGGSPLPPSMPVPRSLTSTFGTGASILLDLDPVSGTLAVIVTGVAPTFTGDLLVGAKGGSATASAFARRTGGGFHVDLRWSVDQRPHLLVLAPIEE